MRIAWTLLLASLLAPLPSRGATPIPLHSASGFVPNRGQAPAEVLYYASLPGGALYLTHDAIVLDTWKSERMTQDETLHRRGHAVRIAFSGANPSAILESEDRTAAQLHFLLGRDRSAWQSKVPVWGSVSYRELWPGIDLTLSAERDGFACRLTASPGVSLEPVRFERDSGGIIGSSTISLADLSAMLARGNDSEIRANPGALLWSTFVGGSAEESAWSAALDSQGNAIVTGLNTSSFFPTTAGAYDQVYSGLGDVFVSKLSADGSELLWSTFIGGTSLLLDYGYAIIIDENDNPLVTGYTRSEDFPVTDGAFATEYAGEADVFVSKLLADGSDLMWSTFIGGVSHDIGYDIDLDAAGNPVIGGRSLSGDFPTAVGSYDTDANGEEDGFLTKLSADGTTLLFSTMLGGQLYDGVQSVRLDDSGAPIVCGYTASLDFLNGESANGLYDIFVAKFTEDAGGLTWSRLIGGGSYDYGTDLALDSAGNPVFCGSTGSSDFPVTRGAYDVTYNGDDDVVVGKLQGSDGGLQWATFVGGTIPVYEIAHGVVMGSGDRPIVVGTTPSDDFPTTVDAIDRTHNGAGDVFLLRLSAAGSELEWSTFLGGPGDDYGYELAKGSTGNATVVITGSVGEGFPVTAGSYDPEYNGDIADVFVARVALATMGPALIGEVPAKDPLTLRVSPNPVGAASRISFTLREAASATIELFDAQGRRCARVDRGALEAGEHSLEWSAIDGSGRRLASGVYALRVTAGDRVQSRSVVLLR